jgi:hypothetical protein
MAIKFFTVEEVAAILKVSCIYLYKKLQDASYPKSHGKRYIFTEEEIPMIRSLFKHDVDHRERTGNPKRKIYGKRK